jgi:hypothetical protein
MTKINKHIEICTSFESLGLVLRITCWEILDCWFLDRVEKTSVGDPDPHVLVYPGSGYISQRYGLKPFPL